jgi:hypothetical protein
MKRVLKSAILSTAVASAVGVALSSCGGGSSSSSTSSTPVASLEKNAVMTVSYPVNDNISKQLLSSDTGAIRVDIYQAKLDADGDIDCKQGCVMNTASVTVTPQNPTATVNLYPTFSVICISQLANTNSNLPLSTICSYADLKPGQNDLKYTLLRGTWSLPTGKDINGYTSFAIGSFVNQRYYYYYYGNENTFKPIASKDGTNWDLSPKIEGMYLLERAVSSNSANILAFGAVKDDGSIDGFLALDGSGNTMEKVGLSDIYYSNSNNNIYRDKILKYKQTYTIKISDKNGKDITNDVLQKCKFSSTDGKSISGCLMKNLKEGTAQDYDYKVETTTTLTAKDLCGDWGLLYDDAQGVCYGYNYSYSYDYSGNYTYICYNKGTYDSNDKRCEISVNDLCQNDNGTYDSTSKVCTINETTYAKGSYETVTLSGKPSLPATGNISTQGK